MKTKQSTKIKDILCETPAGPPSIFDVRKAIQRVISGWKGDYNKMECAAELIAELKAKDLDIIPIIEDLTEYENLRTYRGNVGIRLDVQLN